MPARGLPILLLAVGCGNLSRFGGTTAVDSGTDETLIGPEDCSDGFDNDGDGQLDCGDIDCADTCDADGDGVDGEAYGGVDCDDDDPDVYPGADEVCDGVDSDCDGEDCDGFLEDFESGGLGPAWTTAGAQPWNVGAAAAHGGGYGAFSGNIGDGQFSSISVTLDFPDGGTIEFWHRGDTESGYDFLQFAIDGALTDEWSGNWAWQVASYNVLPGTHTLAWRYDKDGSVSEGQDAAALDDIVATGGSLQ